MNGKVNRRTKMRKKGRDMKSNEQMVRNFIL